LLRLRPVVVIAALLLILVAACEPLDSVPTLQSPVELVSPTVPPTRRPSPTPRQIASPTPSPSPTTTPTATMTLLPYVTLVSGTDAPPVQTLDPVLQTQIAVDLTATLRPQEVVIGQSTENRRLSVLRIGQGAQTILLVGGIHGGWESNTVTLMNELIAYFSDHPEDIAPGISLAILPVLNPDGLSLGRVAEGRFNANGVDLNRNWGCDWAPTGYWGDQQVDAGSEPFSEPESAALADYILINQPAAVLIYHSAANGVFAGACDGDHGSQVLGHIYGAAANYPSDEAFSAYQITGDASNWIDGQGIPAVTIELQSWDAPEFDRNLAGVIAVQCELARRQLAPAARQWAADRCVVNPDQ
jgi:predicted deacylase